MKLKIWMASLFLSAALTNFGSGNSSYDGRVFEAAEKCGISSGCQMANTPGGVRIELGFDGNDNVLSPEANRNPASTGRGAGSSVLVAGAALILASRSLKSR